jgi:hypothetical protein
MNEKTLLKKEINFLEKLERNRELDNWSRFTAAIVGLTALLWFLFYWILR